MGSIVIVFSKIEDAKKIRSLLTNRGFEVTAVCSTGAQALQEMNQCSGGLLISGYRLTDMYYLDLFEYMPKGFEMLLMGSRTVISDCPSGILSVEVPVKAFDFFNTVRMILERTESRCRKDKKPRRRNEREQNYIRNAKFLLMERNHISEEEAHRYIQKCSMDTGTNMVETAQMILQLMLDED